MSATKALNNSAVYRQPVGDSTGVRRAALLTLSNKTANVTPSYTDTTSIAVGKFGPEVISIANQPPSAPKPTPSQSPTSMALGRSLDDIYIQQHLPVGATRSEPRTYGSLADVARDLGRAILDGADRLGMGYAGTGLDGDADPDFKVPQHTRSPSGSGRDLDRDRGENSNVGNMDSSGRDFSQVPISSRAAITHRGVVLDGLRRIDS